MPQSASAPGVYATETGGASPAIAGVPTSITAFVGRTVMGPVGVPVPVRSAAEFAQRCGGLAKGLPLGYAIADFFRNGGSQAVVVRVVGAGAAQATLPLRLDSSKVGDDAPVLTLTAHAGAWANGRLTARVDQDGITDEVARRHGVPRESLLNLTVTLELGGGVMQTETYPVVSVSPDAGGDRLDRVLRTRSAYVRWSLPEAPVRVSLAPGLLLFARAEGGADGAPLTDLDLAPVDGVRAGLYALDGCDLFNLLCIPPDSPGLGQDALDRVWNAAAHYCAARRAFLLVDPPARWAEEVSRGNAAAVRIDDLGTYGEEGRNAAVYFPGLFESDPLTGGAAGSFAPCGAVAGVMARTDAARGVWKSAAGVTDGALSGVRGLQLTLTDAENSLLNPQGINCLRTFPVYGSVVWGARTLKGADALADDYKYIPVRRLALYVEESVYRGTAWAVFEPNAEPLWTGLRGSVSAFLDGLYRQGAFVGTTAKEAYFVSCDATTTSPDDVASGIVNVQIGFAPLRPAEFLVLTIQQRAGQAAD